MDDSRTHCTVQTWEIILKSVQDLRIIRAHCALHQWCVIPIIRMSTAYPLATRHECRLIFSRSNFCQLQPTWAYSQRRQQLLFAVRVQYQWRRYMAYHQFFRLFMVRVKRLGFVTSDFKNHNLPNHHGGECFSCRSIHAKSAFVDFYTLQGSENLICKE